MRILNFGSLNLDHVYAVEHFVRPGETIDTNSYQIYFGGKGHNQSIALAKAGARVWHAGLVGQDGAALRENLEQNGVCVDFVHTVKQETGHAIIQVNDIGQNAILVCSGANGTVNASFVSEVLSHFASGDILLLQNEISCLPFLLEKAKERGLFVVLNPSPLTQNLMDTNLALVDMFLVNEVEGAQLAFETREEFVLQALQQRYPNTEILLTLGKNGAWYSNKGNPLFQASYKTTAVDTTAAGDTFTGYFLAEYAKGTCIKEALSMAAMAASIAVSRKGAAVSIPHKAEVLTHLQQPKEPSEHC